MKRFGIKRYAIKSHVGHVFLPIICSLLLACTPKISININAIVDTQVTDNGRAYVMVSGMQEVNEDDLYFKEFSRYFEEVLAARGFKKVAQAEQADMTIQLKYALSDGRTGVRAYSFPVYEHIGGHTITITTTEGGTPKTTRVHVPSRLERVGTSFETRSFTVFNRSASLKAVAKKQRNTDRDKVLWQVHMHSVAESSDLRQVIPYFAVAAQPYIGENTGQQQLVELEADDPRVLKLKRVALE